MERAAKRGYRLHQMTTITEAIEKAREEIEKKGVVVNSTGKSHGSRKVIYAHTLEVDDFKKDRFPYWKAEEDDWYQTVFVRKETTSPPEMLRSNDGYLFPYTYAHRSRYHDEGFGYLSAVVKLMQWHKADLSTKEGFNEFLKLASRKLHIENILGVMKWQGPLVRYYAENPTLLQKQFETNRKDTLELVIDEIRTANDSSRAITPSLVYESIDKWQGLGSGGIPPYQSYQLFVDNGGIVSVHQHRSLDVNGGVQLDLNHDIEWGNIAANRLGMPLKKIVVVANHFHKYVDAVHLSEKTSIPEWLAKVTYGYHAEKADVDALLKKYEKKVDFAFWRVNG